MKKIFLGLIAASMLVACNQSNKKHLTLISGQSPVTTTTESTVAAPPVTKPLTHADSVNAPMMKFDKDTYNFGKVAQGDKVMHDFNFVNTGKTPLIITDATASCGCTKPEWPKEPIKPGDKGTIKVTFNSTGKQGLQDKLITITSNTVPTQTLVHLAGEVLAPTTTK